jgi:glucose/arabinose dehydrogenase
MPTRKQCVSAGVLAAALLTAGMPAVALHPHSVAVGSQRFDAQVPAGYVLEFLAGGMDGPRLMSFAPSGELLIGSRGGKVYRLRPPYAAVETLVDFGGYPHSVAIRGAEIFVAETGGLYKTALGPARPGLRRRDFALVAKLPSATGGHNSRTVGIGPDGRVYVSLGISGNCSDEYLHDSYPFELRRGGVFVLDESVTPARLQPFASGLRNPVGIGWHPRTGELHATNNGPDHLGYEEPREVLVRLRAGEFHGMPWFQYLGGGLRRDDCISGAPPRRPDSGWQPAASFDARSAPLGMAFAPIGSAWPEGAAVALHGSWGTKPDGGFVGDPATRRPPKVAFVRFEAGRAVRVEDLVTGFQYSNGERWARPAGIAFGPDRALYFTSDGGTVQGLFRVRPAVASRGAL